MKVDLSLVQMKVEATRPSANLEKAEAFVTEAARRGSRLVCLPEMWTTGFQWDWNAAHLGEQGTVAERVAAMARRHGVWLNGSILLADDAGRPANTSILFGPDGNRAAVYRKTHLFTLLHEERHMAPGDALVVAGPPWGPTGLSVCYDVRFPELHRTYALKGVRLILAPAAFPYPRLDHWKVLVRARAIENQLFMVGINQVGSEGYGEDGAVTYFGDSVIVDPWGRVVIEGSETEEQLLTATIDLDLADEVRSRMTVLRDRRPGLYDLG
jgi:omega-amidase